MVSRKQKKVIFKLNSDTVLACTFLESNQGSLIANLCWNYWHIYNYCEVFRSTRCCGNKVVVGWHIFKGYFNYVTLHKTGRSFPVAHCIVVTKFVSLTSVYLQWKPSISLHCSILGWMFLRGVADKSLARPGRKQAIGTKLGIYSTYSQPSSINFLARCSSFCKPLKKKSELCPSN